MSQDCVVHVHPLERRMMFSASPIIESLSITPGQAERGQVIMLSASGVTANNKIRNVTFVDDINDNGVIDAADRILGSVFRNASEISKKIKISKDFSLGAHQVFALATDVSGNSSAAVSAMLNVVNSVPTIAHL